jgi:hypothetical protein
VKSLGEKRQCEEEAEAEAAAGGEKIVEGPCREGARERVRQRYGRACSEKKSLEEGADGSECRQEQGRSKSRAGARAGAGAKAGAKTREGETRAAGAYLYLVGAKLGLRNEQQEEGGRGMRV